MKFETFIGAMTDKELLDLCKDLEKTDTLDGVMSYVLTTSNEWERRVNVPKGTPGSSTSTLRVSPTPRKYVKPENMETLDFLGWLEASSADELESFANKDI